MDFNGDQKADLAVSNYASGNVSILLGDGTGGFAPAVNYPCGLGPYALTLGDVNGDRQLDLVVANHDDSTVSVLLADGKGGFGPPHASGTGLGPYVAAVGEVNGNYGSTTSTGGRLRVGDRTRNTATVPHSSVSHLENQTRTPAGTLPVPHPASLPQLGGTQIPIAHARSCAS